MKQPRELIGIFFALIGTIFTITACVVALLSWLSPFSPVGSSPISSGGQSAPHQQDPFPTPIIIVITATSQIQQPSVPVSTQPIIIPAVESLSSCTSFKSGETRTVSPGTFVLGDIVIDGTIQYTDNVGEGTIAYFEREASVYAKWGAGCLLGNANLVEQVIQGEFEHGCGSACSSIRFVLVQSDGQHVEIRTK